MWPTSTEPWVGACTEARQRSRLLLPAPLRPITTTRSPRPTVKSTFRRTFFAPYDTCTPCTVRGNAPERRRREPKAGLALALHELGATALHALDAAVEDFRLPGPVLGAGPHGVGQGAELADLTVLEGPLLLALLDVGGELGPEGGVVALELPQPAVGHAQDLGDDPVEQLQVVADDEHRPPEARQLGGEPALGGEVEVVGRLVEHEGVGAAEEDAHDVDAPALPTRQGVDVVEQRFLAQPDPLGEAGDVGLEVVPAGGAEPLFEVGEAGDGLGGGIGGHRPASRVHLLVEDVEAPGGEHVGEAGGLEAETPRGWAPAAGTRGCPCTATSPATRRWAGAGPQITDTSEDLPVPLRPTRPTLSSGATMNEASRSSALPPISMVRSLPVITPPLHQVAERVSRTHRPRRRPEGARREEEVKVPAIASRPVPKEEATRCGSECVMNRLRFWPIPARPGSRGDVPCARWSRDCGGGSRANLGREASRSTSPAWPSSSPR